MQVDYSLSYSTSKTIHDFSQNIGSHCDHTVTKINDFSNSHKGFRKIVGKVAAAALCVFKLIATSFLLIPSLPFDMVCRDFGPTCSREHFNSCLDEVKTTALNKFRDFDEVSAFFQMAVKEKSGIWKFKRLIWKDLRDVEDNDEITNCVNDLSFDQITRFHIFSLFAIRVNDDTPRFDLDGTSSSGQHKFCLEGLSKPRATEWLRKLERPVVNFDTIYNPVTNKFFCSLK